MTSFASDTLRRVDRLPYAYLYPFNPIDKQLFLPYTETAKVHTHSSERIADAATCIYLFGTTNLYPLYWLYLPKQWQERVFLPLDRYFSCKRICFVVTSPLIKGGLGPLL